MWVVSPVMRNMVVCFVLENQQAFLVLGCGFIAITLEPPVHDLEVVSVPFACFWCGSFCQHYTHLVFQLDSF
jgi:hypothetical protein